MATTIVAGLVLGLFSIRNSSSLVPLKIRNAVHFSVYYPKTLPKTYTLDKESFRLAEQGVVLFSVRTDKGETLVFSEEQQPAGSEIQTFVSNYIPLNSVLQLPLGEATVGAYGTTPTIRTVASLPITMGPWLIVTAPSGISHDDLYTIMKSLDK